MVTFQKYFELAHQDQENQILENQFLIEISGSASQ